MFTHDDRANRALGFTDEHRKDTASLRKLETPTSCKYPLFRGKFWVTVCA